MSNIKIHQGEIKLVKVDSLKPRKNNRNSHPQSQLDMLAKHYEIHGFRNPLIISNQSGEIVCGTGRYLAAIRAGLKEVPVLYQDYDSPELEYAHHVADNGLSLWSDLDLSGINNDILDLGPDFNIDALGIKDFEIEPADKYQDKDADEVPDVKENIHNVQLGQIWQLGEHRLMCGDSTDPATVEKLMNGEKADMVFTDPPYGVDYHGGHNQKKRSGIQNDKLQGQDLTDLFYESLSLACSFSAEHSAFYIWFANGKAVETFKSFGKLPLKVRAVLCWYKVRSGLGAFMAQYIPNYEPCIYAHKDGCSPQWYGPSDEKTVWELPKEARNDHHPTQKPVALAERAVNNSSQVGQGVLDLFGGSGSTLIACEKTNRKCFMMELDPHYCSVIIERWQNLTGLKANLLE